MNGGFGDAGGGGQRAGTPLGAAIGGLGMQRPIDQLRHLVVLIGQDPLEVCPSRSQRPPIPALLCAGTAFQRVDLATPEPRCFN